MSACYLLLKQIPEKQHRYSLHSNNCMKSMVPNCSLKVFTLLYFIHFIKNYFE
jgi:hypothetical protein